MAPAAAAFFLACAVWIPNPHQVARMMVADTNLVNGAYALDAAGYAAYRAAAFHSGKNELVGTFEWTIERRFPSSMGSFSAGMTNRQAQ
jgi:hypothetical protein